MEDFALEKEYERSRTNEERLQVIIHRLIKGLWGN